MIRRGDIFLVDLNPVQGREQSGRRPVVVVSADYLNQRPLVVTVIPATKAENVAKPYPSTVWVPATETGLRHDSVFLCFQLRSLDQTRFPVSPVGRLSDPWMSESEKVVRFCLNL